VVLSGILCVTARNPVHSVMWLILAFFNAAGLMLLVGAEFIAMLLVIVYVGAVAVLFLFVVMMLDIDFSEMRAGFAKYLPFGIALVAVLAGEIIFATGAWSAGGLLSATPTPDAGAIPNITALGLLIYTRYLFIFEGRGAGAARRADRRDRADASQARRRAPPEYRQAESSAVRRTLP
jgi:NADH-quinone oxidoreductase subunit J